jgi:hypothetical protein
VTPNFLYNWNNNAIYRMAGALKRHAWRFVSAAVAQQHLGLSMGEELTLQFCLHVQYCVCLLPPVVQDSTLSFF